MRQQIALPCGWDNFTVVERFDFRRWGQKNEIAVEAPNPYVHPIHILDQIKHLLLGWTNSIGLIKGGGQATNYQQQIQKDNPLGYWRMDDTVTMIDIGSAGINLGRAGAGHVEQSGGVLFSDVPNLCTLYTGINIFNTSHSSSNNGTWPTSEEAMSLECWFEAGTTPPFDKTCVEVQAPNNNVGETSGQIKILTGSEFIQGKRVDSVVDSNPDTYADGSPNAHHVVLTCPARTDPAAATVHLYVDNIDYGTAAGGGAGAPGALHQVNAGLHWPSVRAEHWLGRVDELAVYDFELSAGQVTQHFDAGASGIYT